MSEYVEGRLLAKLKSGVDIDDIREIIPSAKVLGTPGGIHLISFEDSPVIDEVRRLEESGLVEYAQPDHVYNAFLPTPYHSNDPYYADGNQWALFNQGQNGGVAGADIRAPYAWRILYESGKPIGSSAVKVAVIDTGVDYNHPDLSANCKKADGFDFYNLDADPMDDGDHGTHVAGIIGATGNNGTGVSGVAWACRIYPIKALNSSMQATDTSILYSLDHADMMGCHIVNMSFGSYSFSQALADKIAEMSSVLFVCAAGNDASDNDSSPVYPASLGFNNIISVCNTNNKDQLNSYSNYGATSVHVGAPGSNICSTFPGGIYLWMSGTSMAAPVVTGIAVLLKAAFPALTVAQIRSQILDNVDVIPALSGKCSTGGRVNAYKAFSGLLVDPEVEIGIRSQCAIREAQNDGEYYGRMNGAWVKLPVVEYTAGDGISIDGSEIGLDIFDESGVISSEYLPSSLTGSLIYKGGFDPTVASPSPAAQGWYFIAVASGEVAGVQFYENDWIVYRDEYAFDKISNTSSSVIWGNVVGKPETYPPTLGETAIDAYRGDRGAVAYSHALSPHAPADAERNVQSDWEQTDDTADDYIKNKPAIGEGLGTKVKIDAEDSADGYLEDKIIPSPEGGIDFDVVSVGGVKHIEVSGTQVNFWKRETDFSSTPANASTITTTIDRSAYIRPGMGIRYKIGGVNYYGVVRSVTSSLIGVSGAPLSGTIQELAVCDASRVAHVDLYINGVFNGVQRENLLRHFMKTRFRWMLGDAKLVQISHVCNVEDSGGVQPAINLMVNNMPVCTANSNAGRRTSGSAWVDTVVDISTSNYNVPYGASIEVSTDVGGSGDAECLTVTGVFVLV